MNQRRFRKEVNRNKELFIWAQLKPIGLLGGRLVIVGAPPSGGTLSIDAYYFFMQELEMRSSYFSPYSFQRATQLLHRLNIEPLITHTFDLSDIQQAMEAMKSPERIKILLKP